MKRTIRENPRVSRLELNLEESVKKEIKVRAQNSMTSMNTWVLQAIAEKIMREDRAQ